MNKLKTKGFQASTISTYNLSTLYTSLPHDLIKNQLVDLIENTFRREEVLYLACIKERAFFPFRKNIININGLVKKVIEKLIYLLNNNYIRFGSKLYSKNVGIQ